MNKDLYTLLHIMETSREHVESLVPHKYREAYRTSDKRMLKALFKDDNDDDKKFLRITIEKLGLELRSMLAQAVMGRNDVKVVHVAPEEAEVNTEAIYDELIKRPPGGAA